MTQHITLTLDEIYQISLQALLACGASELNAGALARATAAAEAEGVSNVGLAHLPDYLKAIRNGKINGQAKPTLQKTGAGSLLVEADNGLTMPAFDLAFSALIDAAKTTGIAALAVRNTYTCGVVGYYVECIAEQGLVGQAYANSPAMMAPWGGHLPFFGTNPLAFAVPVKDRPPLIIDQSTASTAYVNIRAAALNNEPLPIDWAFDADGQPTTDAGEALKGTIAPAGGYKGANLALMVDILAAGLTGASWSHAAGSFTEGHEPLKIGQLFLAIDPQHFVGEDFYLNMHNYLNVFEQQYNGHIPGSTRHEHRHKAREHGVTFDRKLINALNQYIAGKAVN